MAVPEQPRTVTLPLRAWILVALVTLAGLGIFITQVVLLIDQRNLIDHQDLVATHQAQRARPVLQAADAVLGSPRSARLALARAGRALDALQRILDAAQHRHLIGTTARSLERVPQLVSDVERAVAILERTYPVLRDSLEVQRGSLHVQESSLTIQRRSLAIQERTLGLLERSIEIQRQARDIGAQTLDVARQTLVHTESLDRKTGGPLP